MSQQNPLVSVIMAARDAEKYIEEALDSIAAQQYQPLEVLVIDGASADRTCEIAGAYPFVRIIQQEGSGLTWAYNTGVKAAQGEFICFLGADDLWRPGKLAHQVRYLRERPEVDLLHTHMRFFANPGSTIPKVFKPDLIGRDMRGRVLETVMVRRSLFEQVGLFDPAYTIAADVDWMTRANDLGCRVEFLDETYLDKRIHETNTSHGVQINTRELMQIMKASAARRRASGL